MSKIEEGSTLPPDECGDALAASASAADAEHLLPKLVAFDLDDTLWWFVGQWVGCIGSDSGVARWCGAMAQCVVGRTHRLSWLPVAPLSSCAVMAQARDVHVGRCSLPQGAHAAQGPCAPF